MLSEHARAASSPRSSAGARSSAFLRADDPRNREIQDLLERVQAASPQVTTRLVDVNRNPALAREYGVDAFGARGGRERRPAARLHQSRRADADGGDHPGDPPGAPRASTSPPATASAASATATGAAGYSGANVALINELLRGRRDRASTAETPVPDDAAALVVAGAASAICRRRAAPDRRVSASRRRRARAARARRQAPEPGRAAAPLRHRGERRDRARPEQRMFAGDYLTMLVPERSRRASGERRRSARPPLMSACVRCAVRDRHGGPAIDLLATVAGELAHAGPAAPSSSGGGEFVAGRDTRGPVPVGASAVLPGDGAAAGPPARRTATPISPPTCCSTISATAICCSTRSTGSPARRPMLGSRPPTQVPGDQPALRQRRAGRDASSGSAASRSRPWCC